MVNSLNWHRPRIPSKMLILKKFPPTIQSFSIYCELAGEFPILALLEHSVGGKLVKPSLVMCLLPFLHLVFISFHISCPEQMQKRAGGPEDNLLINTLNCNQSFPGGSGGKEPACNAGDLGSIPGSGGSPGEGHLNSLQYSCLQNSIDRGACLATVPGVAKNRTQLSN